MVLQNSHRKDLESLMPGWSHRAAHQDAVDSILHPLGEHRKVISEGDSFRNYDKWTLRYVTKLMADWACQHPTSFPSQRLVRQWVERANGATFAEIASHFKNGSGTKQPEPFIQIAATPDQISRRVARAIRGAAFHEALHTAYDIRDHLTFEEIWLVVQENWGLVDDWSKYHDLILLWMNEFQDVKNEQRGIIEYPGIEEPLHSLNDYVVEKEFESLKKEKETKGENYRPNRHSWAVKMFRLYAFGYKSEIQDSALKAAYEDDPQTVAYVTHGPMAKFVKAARSQWELPRTSSLDLAMKLVATFRNEKIIFPSGTLKEILRREAEKRTWGYCRLNLNGGGGQEETDHGTSIIEDAMSSPQHMTTQEVLETATREALYKNPTPMTYEFDRIDLVEPSHFGIHQDKKTASTLAKEVSKDIAFYRSRLRTMVKAQEITGIHHGLPDGIDISDECLVETKMQINEGIYPTEAFYVQDERIDTSTAIYTLMDESGSMDTLKREACKIALSVTEAASGLGCATMVSGFFSTSNDNNNYYRWADSLYGNGEDVDLHKRHYRPWGVQHDVFKTWDERIQHVRWRFSNYRACGGTPIADGIQLALNSIMERKEGHRIIFVVTDGQPDGGTYTLIRDLLDQARRLGVIVVGVGFGPSAKYVSSLFPESVWDFQIEKIPGLLIAKLNKLMDYRGTLLRGRKTSVRVVPKRG